jgi:hypothetical protein
MTGEQNFTFQRTLMRSATKKSTHIRTTPKTLVLVWCVAATLTQSSLVRARAIEIEPKWALPAVITNGKYSGSGIRLTSNLVITAAHVTAGWTGNFQVHIDGDDWPATPVKLGKFDDVDLSLFSVDRQKLPPTMEQIEPSLCMAPARPGDPVMVVDRGWVSWSHVISLTSIADVKTTGNSGSGVFDPSHECLLGIMSRKLVMASADVAKYFVPASEIREFIPAELRGQVQMK